MGNDELLKRFIKFGGITLAVCIVIIGVSFISYKLLNKGNDNTLVDDPKTSNETAEVKQTEEPKEEIINQNIAVFGVDKDEMLTDVIIVVHLDSQTHKVKAISIPRDTKVEWDGGLQQQLSEIREDFTPGGPSWVSKLNEVASKGAVHTTMEESVKKLTIYQLERMLQVKIDNYVIVNLDAFRKVVDAIGGVEVDVPQRMYYTDRAQGLYIDLQPGLQQLDGEHAEMLVRFRQYLNGDVDRIKVQQLFLKALAEKVKSPEIITKVPQLLPVLFSSVKTDIGLMDMPKYYSYLDALDPNNVKFYNMPGVGDMENGISYFFPDLSQLSEVIDEVFYDKEPEVPEVTGEALSVTTQVNQ